MNLPPPRRCRPWPGAPGLPLLRHCLQ